jgi:hypothetical protein
VKEIKVKNYSLEGDIINKVDSKIEEKCLNIISDEDAFNIINM